MVAIVICSAIIIAFWYFLFNPNVRRIRKIQSLINKDRSVCDIINSLDGWEISNTKTKDALMILVNPIFMPMYELYITYRHHYPNHKEVKDLYWELTNENSIVKKAHNMGIPIEDYIEIYIKDNN